MQHLVVASLSLLAPPKPAPRSAPGTTALSSPPGFEAAYEAARAYREVHARPLMRLSQLEAVAPEKARLLASRVDFDVPSTVPGAVRAFCTHPTGRFIGGAFAATAVARVAVGGAGGADAVAFLATASFWCMQEWLIHDKLLHSADEWFGERVHRWHHELPYYHVSMDGLGLAAAWFGTVALLLLGAGWACGAPGPALTSLATYTLFGGLYEACHFIAHTRVPLPAPLAAVRTHHMRHHTLDDSYWLAFTLPAIDDLFGTNPRPRDVVRAGGRGPRRGGRRRIARDL